MKVHDVLFDMTMFDCDKEALAIALATIVKMRLTTLFESIDAHEPENKR